MPLNIYPPTLQSTQPAFLYSQSPYPIYFTLQNIMSFNEIGHIQVRIVKQTNNRTIVNTNLYPDGTIYKNASEIRTEDSRYRIDVLLSDLSEHWQPGYLYKVQMRFGTTPIYTSKSNFAKWKQDQIDAQTFSEWSTVMIIKAINTPEVTIKNAKAVKVDIISAERTETTLTPLFVGSCEIGESSKENVDKFRFTLYRGKEVDQLGLIESSGWLQHDGLTDSVDTFRFKYVLTNNEFYTLIYEIITVNGYEAQAEPYTFLATRTYYARLEDVELEVDDQDDYCQENGCLRIKLNAPNDLSGCFVLTRSDEKSNFTIWEDLQYFLFHRESFRWDVIYDDFTIESGVRYKYAIQQENAAGLRTSPVYDYSNSFHHVDFQHSYLFHNGVQLKIEFNPRINTFKHTVLASKQDTLGDKYPHISKNGYAYYAEFPVSGLISFQMDKDQTFFTLGSNGFYFDGELVIPREKVPEVDMVRRPCAPYHNTDQDTGMITDYDHVSINSNLTNDNIFVERKFREKVEQFLNNFDYKLFRSATEGNIVVGLMNVSLTPHSELGRMIYDFSATAYEVADNSLESLDKNGIINIGEFASIATGDIYLSFGQINGIYKCTIPHAEFEDSLPIERNTNVYSLIKQNEEVSIGGGYMMHLERVRAFWIDRYPPMNFLPQLRQLEAERVKLIRDGEFTTEIDNQIKELKYIIGVLNGPQLTTTILNVNGRNIVVAPNRIYSLRQPVTSFSVVCAEAPIMVNYICELTEQEDLSVGVVTAVDATRIWGQVSGVFTGTDKVLKTYNFEYGPGKVPLRVYNRMPDKTVVYDKLGQVLIDNTNFNVYKTKNLMEIIREDVKHQVELIYNVKGGFYQDKDGRWTNGSIYYDYSDMTLFDIETDPGTILYIGKYDDGRDKVPITIGPTGRYTLNPMDDLVRYIALEKPRFALINYKCLTNQMTLTFRGENNVRSS